MTTDYITTDEAVAYIGQNVSTQVEFLQDTITAASRFIDSYCGRHFGQDTATARIFDSVDGCTVDTGDLVSVTTLKTDADGSGTYETTIASTNYQLTPAGAWAQHLAQPYSGISLLNGVTFPLPEVGGRVGLVEVTGTWGWPAVPAQVKAACRILVAEMVKLKDAPLGVAGGSDFGVVYTRRNLPPRFTDLLADLRHVSSFGIG